jgi:hypothetical protein
MPQSMNTWPETFHKVNLIGELSIRLADLGHLQTVLVLEKNWPVRFRGARLVTIW